MKVFTLHEDNGNGIEILLEVFSEKQIDDIIKKYQFSNKYFQKLIDTEIKYLDYDKNFFYRVYNWNIN